MTEPRNPALEAAIVDALVAGDDATDAFRVYGDWLLERGHVRGELVALHCGGQDASALLAAHAELIGAVAEINQLAAANEVPTLVELAWRCGFVCRAKLADVGHLLNRQHEGLDQARAMRDLLTSPAARFIESIETALPWIHEDGVECAMQDALRAHAPPTLRRLVFASDEQNSFVMVGDVAHLSTTAPKLRELTINAGSFALGERLALPQLEALELDTTSLAAEHVAAILASDWPRLEKLALSFGRGTADLAHVTALLDTAFPELVELGLRNHEFADELIPILATSRLLAQLHVVDLSDATLSDDGARALVAHADRFAHLQELRVANNFVATPSILAGFPVTGLDDQRVFEPEYYERRYAATVE